MELCSEEAIKHVWEGAIPLQIHLHESEITTLPPPAPTLILGPRIGYLPLLIPLIKPHFSSTLPPGEDTVWFDYKGLPLKWYIPIGVLFDLLCAEPERPWNLTVHFRGYPGDILTPCQSEDNVKWSYINSLKEAAYIINGNCKNIMNMSQADQYDLWQSLLKGNMDAYLRISSRLKLGPVGEDCTVIKESSGQPRQATDESDSTGSSKPSRVPIRLYARDISNNIEDLEQATPVDSWDSVSYINRVVEIQKEGGCYMTLKHALKNLLPELFAEPLIDIQELDGEERHEKETIAKTADAIREETSSTNRQKKATVIRIQGIEPDLDIPFFWVINNLKNPEFFIHICVLVGENPANSV